MGAGAEWFGGALSLACKGCSRGSSLTLVSSSPQSIDRSLMAAAAARVCHGCSDSCASARISASYGRFCGLRKEILDLWGFGSHSSIQHVPADRSSSRLACASSSNGGLKAFDYDVIIIGAGVGGRMGECAQRKSFLNSQAEDESRPQVGRSFSGQSNPEVAEHTQAEALVKGTRSGRMRCEGT